MPKIKVKGQMVQTGEVGNSDRQTHTRAEATNSIISLLRYTSNFAVDKNCLFEKLFD